MALARCEKCGRPEARSGSSYSQAPYRPLNHPQSGIVCGTEGCENPGLIWLKVDEVRSYQTGQRIFDMPTQAAKVRVQ